MTKYIVTFQDSATTEKVNECMQQIQDDGGSVINRFPDMIARGFVAEMSDSIYERMQSNPQIDHITPDSSPSSQSSIAPFGIST